MGLEDNYVEETDRIMHQMVKEGKFVPWLKFYFQTGAWERSNSKNVGIFWVALRFIGCYTNPSQLREFLPSIATDGKYYGYSIGWGVEINSLVNIKVLYYKYKKKSEIDYSLPIYQFSFNYSMK